ncbi:MAG: TRAP transporter large permease subunit [Firmicutes bacterium]|nr:TRAP transporter large permease subunit [Bacillota bacterium]
MTPEAIIYSMLLSLIVLIILGYPVAFVLGGIAAIFGLLFIGPQVVNIFMLRIFGITSDYLLIAIPLFVFMGVAIEKSGLASRLYDAIYVLTGRLRGGLALAAVITCTIFAAATGVVGAAVVSMGLLALPSMLRYKYNKSLATGSICAGGTLGILIPPSVLILVYAPLAGISAGELLMAAFIPGFVLSILYILYIAIRCYFQPELGPAMPAEALAQFSWQKKLNMFLTSVVPVSVLILAVLGSIFFGLAAPTEAAGIGAFASLLLAAAYGQLNFKNLKEIAERSVVISCMVYLVMIGASFFTTVFIHLGGGTMITNLVLGLPFPDWGIVLSMFLIVFVMGAFIDWIGILMIVVPLFSPIAVALGLNPIWFAMMVIVIMQTSFLTPPFAYSIFYLKGIAPPEVQTADIYRGVVPFIILQFIGIGLLAIFPQLILWLPSLMGR